MAGSSARGWAAAATLAAIVAVLLGRPLLLGEVLFDRDIHAVWYAQTEVFVRALFEGSWPTWDRSVGFGHSIVGNPNRQVFYPPNWLNLLLPPWVAYTVLTGLHLLLAGAGAFQLARSFSASRAAATLAGGLYLASGPLLSFVAVWHHLAGAAWMPWVLLLARSALDSPRARALVPWAAAEALQLAAGSPDLCVITNAGVAALLVARLVSPDLRREQRVRLLGRVALAAALGALLAAAQWLPSLSLALQSPRSALAAQDRTIWSVEPLLLLQLLLPVSFEGLPGHVPALAGDKLFLWMPFMRSLYLGLAAIGFVAAGLLGRAAWPRRAAALGAGALLLSLGGATPVYAVATQLVPGLGMLRYPSKWTVAVALAWALVAAAGADVWRSEAGRLRRHPLVIAVSSVSLVAALTQAFLAWSPPAAFDVWLAGCLHDRAGQAAWTAALAVLAALALVAPGGLSSARRVALAAGLALVELTGVHLDLNPTADRSLMTSRPETLEFVGRGPERRIYVWDYATPSPRGDTTEGVGLSAFLEVRGRWPALVQRAAALQVYLYPPIGGRFGLAGSFDRDLLGLYPQQLADLNALLRQVEGTPGFARVLAIGGVDLVLSLHQQGQEELRPVATIPGLLRRPVHVFSVPGRRPRAYAVSGARVADGREALVTLVSPEFDPAREIVVPAGEPRPPDPAFSAEVRLSEYRADRVRIDARLAAPGFVVLLDAWDEGWSAEVDGRPAELLRANVGFRAVRVEPGAHAIVLRYRPLTLLIGLGLSLTGLLAAALAWVASGERRPGA